MIMNEQIYSTLDGLARAFRVTGCVDYLLSIADSQIEEIRYLCKEHNGVFSTDLETYIAFQFPVVFPADCHSLIPALYGIGGYPIVESALIRDNKGVPVMYDCNTRLPYVSQESQKEE